MSSFDKKFVSLQIPLIDIQTATNNFADENLIRKDEHKRIYKGQLLRSGKMIDIIARRMNHHRYGEGIKEFKMEIMVPSSLKHENLVTIVGYCDENDEMIIVYKFEAKGNLEQYLSDPLTLKWTQRIQICLDIALVLGYIHYDKERGFNVIHRNVKSSKILLGDKWEAKLSGFGFSTMQPAARRHSLVLDHKVRGTIGYADPAYVRSGGVTHKSDVYSLGVVLFEVLSGRKAFITDNNGVLLASLAKSCYENGTLSDIILSGLGNQIDSQALKIFSEAAYYCLNEQRTQRPNIDRVIVALKQALELQLAREKATVEGTSADHWKGKDLEHLKIGLDAIKLATENFSKKYYIGSGGYGVVYKAELEHVDFSVMKGDEESKLCKRRSMVAIKYIINREDTQGEQGFITEIETLSSCKHPNIVSLLGFCHEYPHMILVYEFVSNGSLDDYLGTEGKMTNLTWIQRIQICIDVACGMDYIHTAMDAKQKIIHRDIKSANILLGENWEAKIADFGLSKLHPYNHTKSTLHTKNVVGTRVYWDPEYESTGHLKKESDVYSFGVVLFEMLTGRLAYDSVYTNDNEKGLAPIARRHFEKGTLKDMVDPKLKEESIFTPSKGLNQDSLHTFSKIAYECLSETQAQRPTMKIIIKELEKSLKFQETQKDSLRISFEEIRFATQDFKNQIGKAGFGKVYRGELSRVNGLVPIAAKRNVKEWSQGEKEFLTELEILFEYKHENIIGLVGYCDENDEKIIVYEYASNGSLDRHVNDASLTWPKRLNISINVAIGLEFLHGIGSTQAVVIHRTIEPSNILLNGDLKAKISDFGRSMITPVNNELDFVVDDTQATIGYVDPQYLHRGLLTRESDIYSLGMILFDIISGRLAMSALSFKCSYGDRKFDKLVFKGIKDKIMPKSLTAFLKIAYECLDDDREKRPTASKVVLQLKKALEFQEDIEIWEVKLPRDYKEIVQMSKTPEIYSNVSNKDLYEMFSEGILLQQGRVCLSLWSNGERNEMVSATTFSYGNHGFYKRRSIQKSRFQRAVKMMDVSNLSIQIKIKTQFLSPNIIYGAHLVFKFCDQRKCSSELMYVNLKYQMRSETRHAYFATRRDDEWMMIELCRFIPQKKDVDFEVLIQSLSKYYCGSSAIYVEGIHFRVIDDATVKVKQPEVYEKLKGIQKDLESNLDSTQQVGNDYHEITQLHDGEKVLHSEKFLLLSNYIGGSIYHMLPAKKVLYEASDVKRFSWKESRSQEVAELLSHQVLQIKCKIKTQNLLANTDYACYLVFELSPKCRGLQCPVKVRDLLVRKHKEFKFLYFRSPRLVNLHSIERVPKLREDGLMEVVVWEFDSSNKMGEDHLPMSLKLRCYEGTMRGLIVYGIEFRPI